MSLRLSTFENDASDAELDDTMIDELKQKVADTQTLIDQITSESRRKQNEYQTTLDDLSEKLENAREVADSALQKQKEDHALELIELQKRLAQEYSKLELHVQNAEHDCSLFDHTRREIYELDQISKMNDAQRKIETEQAKIEESNAVFTVTSLQKSLRKRDSRNSAILKMKALERDISELQASRREQWSGLRLKVTDMMAQIDLKRKDHGSFMRTMQKTMEDRDAQYAEHLRVIREQITHERTESENEVTATSEKCESLQRIYQSITRRGSKQLGELMQDIERMRQLVDAEKEREESDAVTGTEQIAKLTTLSTQTRGVRIRADAITEELARTRQMNHSAAVTLKKKSERIAPKQQTHRKNSIFT